jgi:phosphoglycolate phosphatase
MKYIFWDFNGTILDDANLCYEILNEMLIEENRPTVTFEDYLNIFTFPVEKYYAKVYDLTKSNFIDLAHRFINKYQPRSLNIKLHDNVVEVITYFKNKGITNILLSASETKNLNEQLTHFKIKDLFTDVLGTDNIYAKSKVLVAKDYIIKNQINPKDVLLIGDTLHDAEVALELNFDIILYTKGHQHKNRLKNYKNIEDFNQLIDKI